jgi:tetratricopeptide (TPR) repeat protein
VATLLAELPTLGNGFAQDAKLLVMVEGNDRPANPMVAELQPIGRYFAVDYWHGAGDSGELYRPITVLSFALVRHGLGLPLGAPALAQHAVDVLLHLLATALVLAALRVLRLSAPAAAAAALVFGLHAVHAEAIASVVGRAELIAFATGLGATLLLHAALQASGWRRAVGGASAALGFFLAFAAKESALVWVVLAPVFLGAVAQRGEPAGRLAWRRSLVATAACALPAAVLFLLLRAQAIAASGGVAAVPHSINPLYDAEVATRLATALVVWVHGIGKLVWPFWLVSDYGGQTFALRASLLDPGALAALALLLGLGAGTLAAARRQPLLLLAGTTLLAASALTSNVPFPIGTIFAERLWYAPSLGVVFAVAWLAENLARPWRTIAALVLLGWLAASTWTLVTRLPDWRDDATLLLADVERNPHATRLHTAAAEVLRGQGNSTAAIVHTREAVRLDTGFAGAWSNLGVLLLETGSREEAVAALRRGLECTRRNTTESRLLHLNLGRALVELDRHAEALPELERAHRLAPDWVPPLAWMLEAAQSLGRDDVIATAARDGEALLPGAPVWSLHRGLAAARRGDTAAAERELRAALGAGLDDPRAQAALDELAARRARDR